MLSFLIIIAVAATAATAHILLKIGMNEVGEVNAESIKTPGKLIGELLSTPAILAAIPVYAISTNRTPEFGPIYRSDIRRK